MNNEMPKEYVAELLKQLEELKRKKAHKERKLQKIKNCSLKDLKKERSATSSRNLNQKASDQVHKNENHTDYLNINKHTSESRPNEKDFHLKDLKKEQNTDDSKNSNQKASDQVHETGNSTNYLNLDKHIARTVAIQKEDCHLFENPKFAKTDVENENKFKLLENNATDEDIIKSPPHDKNKASLSCIEKTNPVYNNSVKTANCKLDDITFIKPDSIDSNLNNKNFVKHESLFISDKVRYSVEELPPVAKKLKTEKNLTQSLPHDKPAEGPTSDVNEENKHQELLVEMEIATSGLIINDFKVDKSPQHESKSSDCSVKSFPSSKSKSSDILDDSLNSNMSLFLSEDLFVADFNDKKEGINTFNGDSCTSVKTIKSLEQPEAILKVKNGNVKMSSSVNSNTLPQKNNCGVFNFPKFSTPTEGIVYQPDDYCDVLDLPEKSPTQKLPILVNDVTKTVHTLSKTHEDMPSENKLDSSQLNYVLEKRLSSVLDAHYESPLKNSSSKISSMVAFDNQDCYPREVTGESASKKRKLFAQNCSDVCMESESKFEVHEEMLLPVDLNMKSNNVLSKSFNGLKETDQEMISDIDFENMNAFDSNSDPFSVSKHDSDPLANNSCDDIPSQVTKTVDGLVTRVCEDALVTKSSVDNEESDMNKRLCHDMNEEMKVESEILVIPETEGLGVDFSKDTEEFLETSTLSQSMREFPANENLLNMSSQSKLESPVVNKIIAAVKSSRSYQSIHSQNEITPSTAREPESKNLLDKTPVKGEVIKQASSDTAQAFNNSLALDTSFLEEDTQDLGNFKQVPYMNDVNVGDNIAVDECKKDVESNLNFACSLSGVENEPVIDTEIVVFGDLKYAIIQHKTHIHVWRKEKNMQWIKTFTHQIEDMLSLEKICLSMDDDNLVIVMLLSNDKQYCLQFLIFEKDARVIKLMENTHWLEDRHSEDSILLCGLNGLMFAIAQNKENPEISIHAFISLKENPRLMTAILGSTETPLCSLCKIDKLPNALLGINDSMLYVWHILEARLVTAVTLHPHDYIPIKECFWATVESGLIYFLTTCKGEDDHKVCQLLAANLATGFCQSVMTYSTRPSNDKICRILKAAYEEPFLVVAHSNGAFIWSVHEEFCSAALKSKSNVTTITISRDFKNWGLLAVGSKFGHIDCYSLN